MLTGSRDIAVRLNVAQEVMRVAVTQQAQFVEAAEQQVERAREEEADRVRESDFDTRDQSDSSEREPQDGAGSLGTSLDIEV